MCLPVFFVMFSFVLFIYSLIKSTIILCFVKNSYLSNESFSFIDDRLFRNSQILTMFSRTFLTFIK